MEAIQDVCHSILCGRSMFSSVLLHANDDADVDGLPINNEKSLFLFLKHVILFSLHDRYVIYYDLVTFL